MSGECQLRGVNLQQTDTEVVVLIHGWIPQLGVPPGWNRYEDESNELTDLYDKLKLRTARDGTKLAAFRWEPEAATGGITNEAGGPGKAAASANDLGPSLAACLNSQAHDLRKVHFIAHSAGSWAARMGAAHLLSLNPYVVVQVTLLDPFIPGAPGPFTEAAMNELQELPRIHRLQNYFSDNFGVNVGEFVGCDATGPATNSVLWGNLDYRARYANLRVDRSTVDDSVCIDDIYGGHSGPIDFYKDTIVASLLSDEQRALLLPVGLEPNSRFADYRDVGWFKSIGWDARVTGLLPKITGSTISPAYPIQGDSVTLSIQATGAWAYRWYKGGHPLLQNGQQVTGASYTIDSVAAADAGAYVVRVENIGGYALFSDDDDIELTVSAPGSGTPALFVSGVTPSVLSPVPLGIRQLITIAGSGFTPSSTLLFNDGFNTYPGILPIYVSTNELRYDVSVGPNPATWTVRVVNGIDTSAAFPFYVSGAATTCVDSNEPNDSSGQATILQFGVPAIGLVCHGGDIDWFRIDVAEYGSLAFALTVPEANDYDLELFGPSGTWLAGSYHAAGASEAISWDATTIGTYWVRVYGHPAGHGSFNTVESYALTASVASGAIVFVNHPQNRTVSVGASATFSVTATGAPPLVYQWRRNGVGIPFAYGSSYTTPPATLGDDDAHYSVQASNQFGTKVSDTATLSVNSASVKTWTDSSGDGDWLNPLNWSSGSVPTSSSVVDVNSGDLFVPVNAEFAVMNLDGGTLYGSFLMEGTMNWTSGTLRGTLTVGPGGILNLVGPAAKRFDANQSATLVNAGTVNWAGGDLRSDMDVCGFGSFPARLTNEASGVVNIQTDGPITSVGCSFWIVNNAGLVRKLSAGVTLLHSSVNMTNTGSVLVASGTLRLTNSLTSHGVVEIASGASVELAGNTIFGAAATFRVATGATAIYASGAVTFTPGTTAPGGGTHRVTGFAGLYGAANLPNFELVGGTLAGTFTTLGTLTWTSGSLGGTLTVGAGGVVNLVGPAAKRFDANQSATLVNAGTVNWAGGDLRSDMDVCGFGSFPARLTNEASGVVNIQTDGPITSVGCSFWIVNNAGLVRKLSAGVTLLHSSVNMTNTGSVLVASGTLRLTNSLTSHGVVEIASGASVELAGNTIFGAAATFRVATGATAIYASGAVTFTPGTTAPGGGTHRVTGFAGLYGAANLPNFELVGGTLAGTFTTLGTLTWTSGSLGGTLTVGAGGVVNLVGPAAKRFDANQSATLVNAGTVNWAGGDLRSDMDVCGFGSFPARLTNEASGVVNIQTDGPITNDGCSFWIITNQGLLRKTSPGMTMLQGVSFTNGGTFELEAGLTQFTSGLTQTAGETRLLGGALGAAIFSLTGGVLSGAGTIEGPVVNGSTIRPGASVGTITINGDYTQTSVGTLDIQLGGLTPGVSYDKLVVNGQATLAGTLSVSLHGGFVPLSGNEFTVLSYTSRTGAFDTLTTTISAPLAVAQNVGATSLALSISSLSSSLTSRVDLNGDGNGDAFVYKSSTGFWSRQLSQPGGTFDGAGGGWSPGWSVQPAHFNGDGQTDFFVFSTTTGQWFKMLNDGVGFTAQSMGAWWPGWQRHVLDLDGDGISDLFLYDPVTGQWFKCISRPTGFSYYVGGWSPGWDLTPLRLNGDARDDLFLINRTTGQWVWVLSETGGGFTYPVWGAWYPGWNIYPGDFSGDGISDLLLHNPITSQYYVATNTGTGFSYEFGSWSLGWTPYVVDLDGNNVADLFLYNTSGMWFELLSDGFGHFTGVGSGFWSPGWEIHPTDFNADGRTDLLLYSPVTGQYFQAWNLFLGSFAYFSGGWDTGLTIFVGKPVR